jgi:hypothetical protein
LSKKGSSSNNHITLSENGEIITDPAKVSEVFNDFFSNVANNIGNTNVIVNKVFLVISHRNLQLS